MNKKNELIYEKCCHVYIDCLKKDSIVKFIGFEHILVYNPTSNKISLYFARNLDWMTSIIIGPQKIWTYSQSVIAWLQFE